MTDRPSDRAIAQAFWDAKENWDKNDGPYFLNLDYENLLDRAREIDAAAPEGAQGAVGEVFFTHDERGHAEWTFRPSGAAWKHIEHVQWAGGEFGGKRFEVFVSTTPPQPEGAQPRCPDCNAAVLFECVACSAGNHPKPEGAQAVAIHQARHANHCNWLDYDPTNPPAFLLAPNFVTRVVYTDPPQPQDAEGAQGAVAKLMRYFCEELHKDEWERLLAACDLWVEPKRPDMSDEERAMWARDSQPYVY